MENFEGFTMSDELKMVQTTIRRFMQKEVLPRELALDHDATQFPPEIEQELMQKVKNNGLWCLGVPEEYGGGGLNEFGLSVVTEEMAQCKAGLYHPAYDVFGRYPPNIIWAGTEEQLQRYAVPTVQNGLKTFFAITEPSGGSDPANAIQTRGIRDGDNWVLNGSKIFITGAGEAEWGIVFVRTNPDLGREGISCFIIEKDTPGFTPRVFEVMRSTTAYEIAIEDCVVPQSRMLGEEGKGLDLSLRLLTKNRFRYSAANIGVCVAALKMAVEHSKQRSTFGKPLSRRQAIQWMLADSEVEIRAARWLTWEGCWKHDRGEDYRIEASICKLYSGDVLWNVIDRCVQIFGGYGLAKEYPFERWLREARFRRIGEGPSEVHRMVVSRGLIKSYIR